MNSQNWKIWLEIFFLGSPLLLAGAHAIHVLCIKRHLPIMLHSLNEQYIYSRISSNGRNEPLYLEGSINHSNRRHGAISKTSDKVWRHEQRRH